MTKLEDLDFADDIALVSSNLHMQTITAKLNEFAAKNWAKNY